MFPNKLTLAALASAVALTGCMGNMKVQPMVSDPQAYSVATFTRAALPMGTQAMLKPAGSEPFPFKRIEFKAVGWSEDKPELKAGQETAYINDDNDGTLRQIRRTSLNGLTASQTFELQYHGLASLASQNADPARSLAYPPTFARAPKSWSSLAQVTENGEYRFEAREGTKDPFDMGTPWRRVCVTGKAYDASQVLAELPGKAIEMVCTDSNQNGVTLREVKYAWVSDLGLPLVRAVRTTRSSFKYEYQGVKIDK
ncbi:hypothetical protein [Bordetella holmesii]|nr:hypothetical protein [Bordetella holmesii]EWM48890.1 putative lipoprotein [Bordetella holmesii 41130]KAK89508.1 putative lipoprotein [Bordetella holmesii CDC-H635-BH]KAK90346.1 putative lipoprotein [Bordetella holmesii CDC-H585-BH]KCV07216.1 putative lipoprotein [Bordetella holmesii CDC-H785-BH]KCV15488.1 putative lipoprotein [Bordetella holmesii CDC-H643-BH]